MSRLFDIAREKAHQRTITITTYPAGQDKILIEGVLIDRRFTENYLITGEKRPVGNFHHMVILLLVNSVSMRIEDVDVELITTPRDECKKIKDSLNAIKGEWIIKGFSSKINSLIGNEKSCAHLRTLLLAMSPTAIQGAFSIRAQKPLDLRYFINNPQLEKRFMSTLLNTCYVWRENGPEYRNVLDMIDTVRRSSISTIDTKEKSSLQS